MCLEKSDGLTYNEWDAISDIFAYYSLKFEGKEGHEQATRTIQDARAALQKLQDRVGCSDFCMVCLLKRLANGVGQ